MRTNGQTSPPFRWMWPRGLLRLYAGYVCQPASASPRTMRASGGVRLSRDLGAGRCRCRRSVGREGRHSAESPEVGNPFQPGTPATELDGSHHRLGSVFVKVILKTY